MDLIFAVDVKNPQGLASQTDYLRLQSKCVSVSFCKVQIN